MKYFANVRHSVGVLFRHRGWSWKVPLYAARSVAWYASVAFGREPSVRIREWSAMFVLPCLWRTPAKLFYVFRRDYESEIELIEGLIEAGDGVIDVGANFGLYTVLAGKKVGPEGQVIAFEPFPDSFRILQRNCRINDLEGRTQLHECALGEAPATLSLSVHADPGRNTLGSLGTEEVSRMVIPVRTLDQLHQEEPMSRVDLIKMDVEGYELQVLRGARQLLGEFRPTILFELNPTVCRQSGYQAGDIVEFLESSGYVLFEGDREGGWREVHPEEYGNYLGIHRERLRDERFRGRRFQRLE